jgi:hypothetical protein
LLLGKEDFILFFLIYVFAIVANNSVAEEFGGEEKNG